MKPRCKFIGEFLKECLYFSKLHRGDLTQVANLKTQTYDYSMNPRETPGPSSVISSSLGHSSLREESRDTILALGRNVWKIAEAKRFSFLIDADAFFRAFVEAIDEAKVQVVIVGWDTDSRTPLPNPGLEHRSHKSELWLAQFLEEQLLKKPRLSIHILSWNFSFIYQFEREFLSGVKFNRFPRERLRFVLDCEHPPLASQHQKIIVVDDQLAFCGGLDLTQRRWDTQDHLGFDRRRVDSDGYCYGPFHDVQACVDGEAARALGSLVRTRWLMATGEKLPQPHHTSEIWPKSAPISLHHVGVGISRTQPPRFDTQFAREASLPAFEVERLWIDGIRRARRFIYIENQYFTSPLLAKSLARRLADPDGPEIIMVLPRDQTGWIEESTMGLLRSNALRIIERADRFNRFRCYYPIVPGLGAGYVKVHSKVMIIDDEYVRIGSANMNNRSLGVDSECDISVEDHDREDVKQAISRLRWQLIAEHLGVDPECVLERERETGSLVQTVESLRGGERTFVALHPTVPEWLTYFAPPPQWIDPLLPFAIRRWFARRLGLGKIGRVSHFLVGVALLCIAVTVVYGVLSFRSPAEASSTESFHDFREFFVRYEFLPAREWLISARIRFFELAQFPAVLFVFVIAGIFFVPLSVLVIGVGFIDPTWRGMVFAILGVLVASMVMYAIGRYWTSSKSSFLKKPSVQNISAKLAGAGVWQVTKLRLAPVVSFSRFNLVAGGLRVPLRTFFVGTVFGMLPGVLLMVLLSGRAAKFIETGANPTVGGSEIEVFIAVVIMILVLRFFLKIRGQRTQRKVHAV